jgi:tetratricopeptide (TPR) repeat protein
MSSRSKSTWLAVIGTPLLFSAIFLLQLRIDKSTTRLRERQDELMLQSGSMLKKMSLGYDSLLADIYWTRAVQYYGDNALTPGATFKLLWPLLDITTTLDPRLTAAYRFGAIFLSEPPPIGAGRPDLAIELIQRGIAANPDDWQMNANLGFLYYWHLKDYGKSAAAYLKGSENPKAPGWLGMMAARVAMKGDGTDTSKMIWAEIYNTTPNPAIRKSALEHLQGLQALEDVQELDRIARNYNKGFGHYPKTMQELLEAGLVRQIPTDPTGVPYVYGADGKAKVGPDSMVVVEAAPKGPAQ